MKTGRLQLWAVVLVIAATNAARLDAVAMVPQVYAGACANSSFLVDGAGTLNAWGNNGTGGLGIGGFAGQSSPVAAPFPSGIHGWRAVAAASDFSGNWTYAIGDDSQLYGAGHILSGFDQNLTLIPPPAGAGGWLTVSASDLGWLGVSTNGPIYGNIDGSVLWQPRSGATHWTQVAVGSYPSVPNGLSLFALDNRGKLYGAPWGTAWFSSPTFVEIPVPAGATAWTNIIAGANTFFALADDGNLYAWGENGAGQLGLGSTFIYTNTPQLIALPAGKTGWRLVSAGEMHTMATTTDGQLFVWGANNYGQLGLSNVYPDTDVPTAVPNLTNVTAIATGSYHSLVIADCQVLAWGNNADGELGLGFTSPYYPQPANVQFNYDICSTVPPPLPLVSITAEDPNASEGTWLSTLGQPATNSGLFVISRTVPTTTSLNVNIAIDGTASNGVDYVAMPTSVTIPANSNSVLLAVTPTGSILAADPSTVVVNLLPDTAYQLGNSTNATVTLIQYQSPITPPFPVFMMQLFVGTNLNGQVFVIQSSTNLINWDNLGTATNVWGVVTVAETNHSQFRERFFRALPISGR